MAKAQKKLMTYAEILGKMPDWKFSDAFTVFEEETPALTEESRRHKRITLGYLLKFMQDNGLTRHIIAASAPDIPNDLVVYYRDLVPEALEFRRMALDKWYDRFDRNGNADPSDVRLLEKYLKKMRDTKEGHVPS